MQSAESIFNQIRNLSQYKDKSDDEVMVIAKEMANQRLADVDIESRFVKKEEKKLAKDLLHKYLKDYTVQTISDKNLLKDMIYLEVINVRLQDVMNELSKTNKSIPVNLVDSMHKNLNQIILLKEKLGINREEQSDSYKAIQLLLKKFEVWRDENVGSRQMICPHCGGVTLLKIRTDKYDIVKHPFFKGRILYNEHLFKCYTEGKITKTDVAKVLEVSEDYIDWIISKQDSSFKK